MSTLQEAFDFDETDLMAHKRGVLSERQKHQVRQETLDFYDGKRQNYKLQTYFLMMVCIFMAFGLFVLLLYRMGADRNPLLGFVMIVLVLVLIVLVLCRRLIIPLPDPQPKLKRKYHYPAVHNVTGRVTLFSFTHRHRRYFRETKTTYRARIYDGKEELTFIISLSQYEALENKAHYIFYFANSQILSVEKLEGINK